MFNYIPAEPAYFPIAFNYVQADIEITPLIWETPLKL
jgi:hypothetical protein